MTSVPAERKTRRGWESQLFLTVAEVAELMRADPRTVRRAIELGQIPAVRLSDATCRIPTARFIAEVLGQAPEGTAAGSPSQEPTASIHVLRHEDLGATDGPANSPS